MSSETSSEMNSGIDTRGSVRAGGLVVLELVVALTAVVGGGLGLLLSGSVYGEETLELQDAATAQDIVTLVLGLSLLYVWTPRPSTSSSRPLLQAGAMAFLAYNAAIYCFSVSFGPLFLLWTATLGLATAGTIAEIVVASRATEHRLPARRRFVGWSLIGISVLFAMAWFAEIVPDLLAGRASSSAAVWDVPTNPVHVLDLAYLLPAAVWGGVMVLRGARRGAVAAPVVLTVFALMSVPILVTPLVADLRGHEVQWAVAGPIGTVLVVVVLALAACLAPHRNNPDHASSSIGGTS